MFGSNLDGSLSDKTELLEHVLENQGIAPQNAVMIGDRRFDMIGAKNHGIKALGVLWGYGSEAELKAAGDHDGLAMLPRNSSPTRWKNRCAQTGRPRACPSRPAR